MREKVIRAIIIEDEPRSAELIKKMLKEHCPEVTVKNIASNVN